jgi:hypothetical protein
MVEALLKIFSLAKIVRWDISFIFKNYKIIFYIICTCRFPAVSGSWFFKNLTNPYPDPDPYPNPGNLAAINSIQPTQKKGTDFKTVHTAINVVTAIHLYRFMAQKSRSNFGVVLKEFC